MKQADLVTDPHIWMIRTSENVLSGPYTQEQLIQLVEEEKLELTDEICRGNSYWIYLHEEQEVKKLLGIEVPAALVEPEEPTQTETDSIVRRESASAAAAMGARVQRHATVSPEPLHPNHPSLQSQPVSKPAVAEVPARTAAESPTTETTDNPDDVPELAVSADSIEDHTAVLNNRAFREFRPRDPSLPQSAVSQTIVPQTVVPQPVVSQPAVAAQVVQPLIQDHGPGLEAQAFGDSAPIQAEEILETPVQQTQAPMQIAVPEVQGVATVKSYEFDEDEDRTRRFRMYVVIGVVLTFGAIYLVWHFLRA